VTIAGPGSDGGATGPTDAGADQLARAATHALADGGAAQGTDGAAEGSFILVAPVGRGRTTGRTPQGGPHQAPVSPPSSLPIMVPATPRLRRREWY
jgi:hypothetical protein